MAVNIKNEVNNKNMNKPSDSEYVEEYKWDIYWPNVILLTLIHAGAIYGMFLRRETKPASEIFMKAYTMFCGFGVTAGSHRLWSHKSYKATTLGQLILMFLASSSYQNSIYTWVRDHRMHHKYTETDADPHNAKRGFFFSHMGWLMVRKHKYLKSKKSTIDLSDLESDRMVMFQHKYYFWIVLLCTVGVSTVVPMYFFGESLKVALFRITMYKYVVVLHFTWSINSFAHLFGNKPYDAKINPTECNIIRYLHVGEQFHNYHHSFPWDYKTAEMGDDGRNLTTYFIDLLAWFGLVYDRNTASKQLIDATCRNKGDGTFNSNKTILHAYLPEAAAKFLKNIFNASIFWLFLYIL